MGRTVRMGPQLRPHLTFDNCSADPYGWQSYRRQIQWRMNWPQPTNPSEIARKHKQPIVEYLDVDPSQDLPSQQIRRLEDRAKTDKSMRKLLERANNQLSNV